MTREDLKEELFASDEEYRRLSAEHQDCERRLNALTGRSLLSQEDEIEEKRIKRHKLTLKDRMEQILRSHVEERVTA